MADPTQLLKLVSYQGLPNPTIVVGVWLVTTNPGVDAPAFTVTLSLTPADLADATNALIMGKVHAQVDLALTQLSPIDSLKARVAPFVGLVIPHTYTPPA